MENTYDIILDSVRVETTTNIHDVYRAVVQAEKLGKKWLVLRTSGIDNKLTNITDINTLEADIMMVERRVWFDVETKKAMGWKPFDEAESGIHLKEAYDNNVKTAAAVNKPKMSAVPTTALLQLGEAMQNGADKYGRFNWRSTTVSATVFYDAIQRHLLEWYEGIDRASDSNVHHLAHIMANCAIILDSEKYKVFSDDRYKK